MNIDVINKYLTGGGGGGGGGGGVGGGGGGVHRMYNRNDIRLLAYLLPCSA